MPNQNLSALKAELEAELQRRRDAKIAAGEVVVVVPECVVTATQEMADAEMAAFKAREIAERRARGVEVIFDDDAISVVITGVPDADDPDGCEYPTAPGVARPAGDATEGPSALGAISEVQRALGEPVASGTANLSVPSLPETPIWVQIRPGNSAGDPGAILQGSFSVESGVLLLFDHGGKQIATQMVLPGDDFAAVARRLLRGTLKKAGASDFERPLQYPNSGF